jgi:hypothetical protein
MKFIFNKSFIKWLAGITFIIAGFSQVSYSVLGICSFILFMCAGAICMPPILNLIEKKLRSPLISIAKYVLVIIFWFGGVYFMKINDPHVINENLTTSKIIKKEDLNRKSHLDSIIKEIKKEKDFKVTHIDYKPDSTLCISIKTKKEIQASYFDNYYEIFKIGNVSEITVFRNGQLHSTIGYHSQKTIDDFNKNFVSGYDGSCRPVEKYIKTIMNDPSTYEHDRTFVTNLVDGTFEVKTLFRGSNSFGAIVLNTANATVSRDGEIIKFSLE